MRARRLHGHLDPHENGAYGGGPERQLVAATVASDVARVKQLLASGADPNEMAPYEGHQQSAWKLALHQARAGRRDHIEMIEAMLQAHALLLAAENSEDEIVHVLVEAGVDVKTPRAADTPLAAAINARIGALIIYLEQHAARKKP